MGGSKCSSKKKVHSNTILLKKKKTRKTLNRQLNFTPKTAGKMRTKKKLVEGK